MGTINRQVSALVKQRFGPATRQLQAQAPRTADWYKQYQAIIGKAGQQAQADTTQAVGAVQGLQAGLDSASQAQWAGQQAQMAKDAAVRGAQTDPGLADVAHNASNARNVLTGSYGALLAGLGRNESAYLGNRRTIAKQQGVEALQRNQGARQELAQQQGEYAASTKQQLVSDAAAAAAKASQDAFNQYIQNARLGIAAQSANTTASLGSARLGIAQQNANTARRRANRSSVATKDPYGNTPLQQRSHTSSFRNIQRNAAQIHQLHPELTWKQVLDAVAPDYSTADADVLTGAVQQGVLGRVGPQTVSALRRLGIDPTRYARGPAARRVTGGATGYSQSGGHT